MLHAAQVIDAVAARLTGATSGDGRVYTSRVWPLREEDLPAWRVYAGDEQIDSSTIHSSIEQHTLDISAVAYVRAIEDLDDLLNDLTAEGLTALFATDDPLISGKSVTLSCTRITRSTSSVGQASDGEVELQLQTTFFAAPHDPHNFL